MYAGENISLGQNSVANGVNLVGGKDVTIAQDFTSVSGTIQSAQKVIVGQNGTLTAGDWLDAIPNGVSGTIDAKSVLVQ